MSGKCIGCFVIKLNISRNLGKKEFFCQVLLFLEYSLEKSYSWLIHWDSRCEPWLLWPGKDRSWKKDDDLPSIHTYVQQHLEEYGWRLLDWPHQQRNHEWKKSHANQSIFFHYPCLQKIYYCFFEFWCTLWWFCDCEELQIEIITFIGIVGLDMANMMLGKPINSSLNGNKTIGFPHGQSRKVGMCTSSIPVTLKKERQK